MLSNRSCMVVTISRSCFKSIAMFCRLLLNPVLPISLSSIQSLKVFWKEMLPHHCNYLLLLSPLTHAFPLELLCVFLLTPKTSSGDAPVSSCWKVFGMLQDAHLLKFRSDFSIRWNSWTTSWSFAHVWHNSWTEFKLVTTVVNTPSYVFKTASKSNISNCATWITWSWTFNLYKGLVSINTFLLTSFTNALLRVKLINNKKILHGHCIVCICIWC